MFRECRESVSRRAAYYSCKRRRAGPVFAGSYVVALSLQGPGLLSWDWGEVSLASSRSQHGELWFPGSGSCSPPRRVLGTTRAVRRGCLVLSLSSGANSVLCSFHSEIQPAQRRASEHGERLEAQVRPGLLQEHPGLPQRGALHGVPAPGPASGAGGPPGRAGSRGAPQTALPRPRLRSLRQRQVQRLLQRVLPVQAAVRLTDAAGRPGHGGPRALAGVVLAPKYCDAQQGAAGGLEQGSGEKLAAPSRPACPGGLGGERGQGLAAHGVSAPARSPSGLLLLLAACHAEGRELHGRGLCARTASWSRERREKTPQPSPRAPARPRVQKLRENGRLEPECQRGTAFPCRLVPVPRTRRTRSHPQTVVLRLLKPNQFTLKSKPAALYSMHLGKNLNILVGRCVTIWVSLSSLLEKLARTEACIKMCTYIMYPYIMYEGFFFIMLKRGPRDVSRKTE